MKKSGGLTYELGDADDARMANIDQMGSDDPVQAAVARLARDLVNVTEDFLRAERRMGTPSFAFGMAVMHGVSTVVGTIAVNLDNTEERKQFLDASRCHVLSIFDEMARVVTDA